MKRRRVIGCCVGFVHVCFGTPYEAIYALSVGVVLATNSPWPLEAGDPKLTRRVAILTGTLPATNKRAMKRLWTRRRLGTVMGAVLLLCWLIFLVLPANGPGARRRCPGCSGPCSERTRG